MKFDDRRMVRREFIKLGVAAGGEGKTVATYWRLL